MKPIPREVDELMWLVAEQNDPRTLDDFERRYPEFVGELGKRLAMVRSFRGARTASHTPERPFVRPVAPPAGFRSKGLRLAFGAAGLVGLAFASYYLTQLNSAVPNKLPKPVTVNTAPIEEPPESKVQYSPALPSPQAPVVSREKPVQEHPIEEVIPSFLKPTNLKLEKQLLQNALSLLGAESGLKFEFAPGMPNPVVSLNYSNVSAIDIIKDLGIQYGFTAFDQGEGHVLVIPAVDVNSPDVPPADSKAEPTKGTVESSPPR